MGEGNSTKVEENRLNRSNGTNMEGNPMMMNRSAKMVFVDQGSSTGLVENLVTIVDNLTSEREKGGHSSQKDKDKVLDKDKDMVPDPREVVDYDVRHNNWEEGISSPAGLWKHHMPGHHRIHTKRKFHREADTPTLVISLVLGVSGLLILILLLSMVAITLAEGRDQHLISNEEEDEEDEEGGGDVVCGGGSNFKLWAALKRGWTSVGLPLTLRGFVVNLQERDYIQVI